ncbi:MAG: hypothetical protein H0T76_22370 [Nannocystis sp.]|nr:hypothetical protein [Nannocystis sp.]MBA3549228.1 hypothetical protein [Nannocystis sp.]
MRRLSLAVLTILAGCHSPEFLLWQAEQEKYASMSGDSSGDVEGTTTGHAEPASTGTGSESAGGSATESSDTTDTAPLSGSATDTGDSADSTDTADSTGAPPVGEPEKPKIVSVELPAKVYAAGPVLLTVQAEGTASASVRVDGVDAGSLIAAGDGLFTGELTVRGAIDNGSHEVEVIAKQGEFEDSRLAMYEVSTPKPGTEAWSKTGPTDSRTNRVALTPAGDLIEVGQTVINGVPRPTIRLRSRLTGAELWPKGTILLDTREGAVVDVAVLADGRMWVAMNVRELNKDPRPRLALLDADGQATGIEAEGAPGRVVRAIAADAEGGCFAVGLAVVLGDWDVAYWRITAAGEQTLGDAFDYFPLNEQAHTYRDFANDVLIDGDLVWVIGVSAGSHGGDQTLPTRGMILRMNLHTGEVTAPGIIAPVDGGWTQSVFFGAALHPEGVVVTGYGCDTTCSQYRIETSRYTAAGGRLWHQPEPSGSGLAYGSDVALDSQGRALVAAVVTQNGTARGYVFGRRVNEFEGQIVLEHWFPGAGPSEALGIVRDAFDRIFPVGYITSSGNTQARLARIHG